MAWTGTLARTERHGDSLTVIIHYVDDQEREYDQTLTTSSAQGDSWLQDQITTRLNQLNALDVYEQSLTQDTLLTSTFAIDQGNLAVIPVIAEPPLVTPAEPILEV